MKAKITKTVGLLGFSPFFWGWFLTLILLPEPLAWSRIALPAENLVSAEFQEIEKKVILKGNLHGVSQVLVVFDMDNTLLAMTQNLGSDQWFNWQAKNLSNHGYPHRVADDFPGLIQVQGILFNLSRMRPTEPKVTQVVKNLQKKGYKIIVLTSRGNAFRSVTQRELKAHDLWFAESAIGPKGGPKAGYPGVYKPYDLSNPEKSGLTREEVKRWKLGGPRTVSYLNGIYMTQGLHKGAMLRTLLKKTGKSFKSIIFVDDHEKHTRRMTDAFRGRVDLVTYRFSRENPNVKSFNTGNKKKTIQNWKKVRKILRNVFDRKEFN